MPSFYHEKTFPSQKKACSHRTTQLEGSLEITQGSPSFSRWGNEAWRSEMAWMLGKYSLRNRVPCDPASPPQWPRILDVLPVPTFGVSHLGKKYRKQKLCEKENNVSTSDKKTLAPHQLHQGSRSRSFQVSMTTVWLLGGYTGKDWFCCSLHPDCHEWLRPQRTGVERDTWLHGASFIDWSPAKDMTCFQMSKL